MPRELEHAIIEFLTNLFQTFGWGGVFLGMAIESAAIPLPSEVIMPLAGWLLIQAKGDPLSYTLIAGLAGGLGCVAGSLLTYYIGAIGGRPLLLKYGKYIFINEHHIDLADKWFAERGEVTAFVSRLLPVVRTFISIPAGIARMNVLRFTFYTFIGSFIWCTALAAGGWYFGSKWEDLRNVMRPFDYPIAAIVLAVLIYVFIRGRQSAKRRAVHVAPVVAAPVAPMMGVSDVPAMPPVAPVSPSRPPRLRPGDTPNGSTPLGFNRPRRDEVRAETATGSDAPPVPIAATTRTGTPPDAPPATMRIPNARPVVASPRPPSGPAKPRVVPPPPMSHDPITETAPPAPGTPVGNQKPDNGDIYSWFGGQTPPPKR